MSVRSPPISTFRYLSRIDQNLRHRAKNIHFLHCRETLPSLVAVSASANGMQILRKLSPDLHERISKAGFLAKKFVFKSARGWTLSTSSTGDLRGDDEEEFCLSISRHELWRCLREEVGEEKIRYGRVVSAKGGEKPSVTLDDGSIEEADLVVGADGVWSVVRQAIFGEGEFKPQYEGLVGVGGFINSPPPSHVLNDESMVFTFGRNGFFGYAASSPSQTMWWSTCQKKEPPKSVIISAETLRKELQERHGDWADPAIHDIVEAMNVESIYPVWTTPELPYWGEKGLVLIGDAAHALQPTSGQGASQALEDARILAGLLRGSLEGEGKSMQEEINWSLKAFYDIKAGRVSRIRERARRLDGSKRDMNTFTELVTCLMLWTMGKMPSIGKLLIGDVVNELYRWDIERYIAEAIQTHSDNVRGAEFPS